MNGIEKTLNKKTIVIFSCFYEPYISGAERFVKEVVERLSTRYRFIVISAKIDKNLKKIEKKDNYIIYRVGFGKKYDKWIYPILAPISAFRCKPDLVHAVMESYAGIALWLFSFISKAPRILTLQSGDLDHSSKQEKIPNWLWKKIHTTPTHITAISNYLKNRALSLGREEEKTSIIPNGVDLERIYNNETIERIPFRIICVGRLSWEKGHEYLIRAMPKIREEFPEARLVLVGDGPLKDSLKGLVYTLNLQNYVDFMGLLPHKDTMREIKRSSLFICPSLAEGLGIVFIEAQACGVPVIGTNIGGIPDVVRHGSTGLLVPPKDSKKIAETISCFWKNEWLQKRLVQNAKEHVKKFEWSTISEDVSKTYEKFLNTRA